MEYICIPLYSCILLSQLLNNYNINVKPLKTSVNHRFLSNNHNSKIPDTITYKFNKKVTKNSKYSC